MKFLQYGKKIIFYLPIHAKNDNEGISYITSNKVINIEIKPINKLQIDRQKNTYYNGHTI